MQSMENPCDIKLQFNDNRCVRTMSNPFIFRGKIIFNPKFSSKPSYA